MVKNLAHEVLISHHWKKSIPRVGLCRAESQACSVTKESSYLIAQ